MVDGGEKDEHVGVAVLAEKRAGHVLVDDRRNALVAAVVVGVTYHGDATAAAGDDDELVVEQVEDRVGLDDAAGARARDHAAIASAGVLDELEGRVLLGLRLSLLLREEGADGLGGVLEARVIGVDLDLGHDGCHVPLPARLVHLRAEPLLEVVADIALAHGAALGKVHDGNLGVLRGGDGERLLDHAHLGAVPVGDDDLGVLVDDAEKRGRRGADALDLLLGRVSEGVAPEGDDDAPRFAGWLSHDSPIACADVAAWLT